jgi:hypothetical protein
MDPDDLAGDLAVMDEAEEQETEAGAVFEPQQRLLEPSPPSGERDRVRGAASAFFDVLTRILIAHLFYTVVASSSSSSSISLRICREMCGRTKP